ncbi:hypothetical protein GW17_00009111 [Ensete ventricosum]|nr:hypothetical protein GW17_00009111 [Ensete ventricosum]
MQLQRLIVTGACSAVCITEPQSPSTQWQCSRLTESNREVPHVLKPLQGTEEGGPDLLIDLTKSEAEGWRIRSKKSCQVRGAVEEQKASPPPPPFSISWRMAFPRRRYRSKRSPGSREVIG